MFRHGVTLQNMTAVVKTEVSVLHNTSGLVQHVKCAASAAKKKNMCDCIVYIRWEQKSVGESDVLSACSFRWGVKVVWHEKSKMQWGRINNSSSVKERKRESREANIGLNVNFSLLSVSWNVSLCFFFFLVSLCFFTDLIIQKKIE